MTRADDPRFGCDYPGCDRHPSTGGGPIFRVSPKGEDFVGLCREHLDAERRDAGLVPSRHDRSV